MSPRWSSIQVLQPQIEQSFETQQTIKLAFYRKCVFLLTKMFRQGFSRNRSWDGHHEHEMINQCPKWNRVHSHPDNTKRINSQSFFSSRNNKSCKHHLMYQKNIDLILDGSEHGFFFWGDGGREIYYTKEFGGYKTLFPLWNWLDIGHSISTGSVNQLNGE